MLVTSKQIILNAKKGGYAIGCFNTSDLEITKAIVKAAESQKAPVIISTSEKAIGYAGLENLADITKNEAESASVPIALHLDHGQNVTTVEKCLQAGYTSIMFDGSSLPLEENELKTRHAVELSHHQNIPCEGELGHLGKAGVNSGDLTDPADVADYITRTGVDFLAVSIGSKHGNEGKDTEKLDIDLLAKISNETEKPLVLHGASGVRDDDIREAVKHGIAKINIDTDIRQTFVKSLQEAVKGPNQNEPRDILTHVMEKIQKLVEEKIELFGSAGKAKI